MQEVQKKDVIMSSNTKHTNKMRKNFRYCLINIGGQYKTTRCKCGIKDIYTYEDKKEVYIWHLTPSSSRVINHKYADLNHIAKRLGIYDQWSIYTNDNTIYMQGVL